MNGKRREGEKEGRDEVSVNVYEREMNGQRREGERREVEKEGEREWSVYVDERERERERNGKRGEK